MDIQNIRLLAVTGWDPQTQKRGKNNSIIKTKPTANENIINTHTIKHSRKTSKLTGAHVLQHRIGAQQSTREDSSLPDHCPGQLAAKQKTE